MGVSSCNNLCGCKKYLPFNNSSNLDSKPTNNYIINSDLIQHKNYNNFTKKFEANLHTFGDYCDINDLKQKIPQIANNYMIENVLSIPENILINRNTFEMKPIKFENGNIYCGNWNEKYKMDGLGQYYLKEGNLFIEGIWDDGKLIYGRIFYSNDNIYEGQIKDSNYNGKGKLLFNNGEIYEGDFLNGSITGSGVFTFSDGTIYEGEFIQGVFKGHGIMKWINGIFFEGEFNGIFLSNYGKLIGDNGEKYEGNFYYNYFHGKGIYTFIDNSTYEGEFEFGLRSGKGIYKKKDEFIFEGEWANDVPHGFGKYYYNNYIIKGVWRNGINVEIISFEKGNSTLFNKFQLNFEIKSFNLLPHMLPNLEKMDSKIKKFDTEITLNYLNTFSE